MDNYAAARLNMVESQVRPSDVTDARIMRAMGRLPREKFVPLAWRNVAYMDESIPLADRGASSLMEPRAFAKLVQLASVTKNDLVLDIGCGLGYSSAVLAQLAGSVVALEADGDLVNNANEILASLEIGNVAVVEGELSGGVGKEGPYDIIFLNGSIEIVPDALFGQLNDNGRLVAVINEPTRSAAWLYEKSGELVNGRPAFDARIQPLSGFEKKQTFVF